MKRDIPKQWKNPLKAIREFCTECNGGRNSGQPFTKLIKECVNPYCPVYAFRFGTNPYHKQKLSKEQRKALSDRAKNSALIQRAAREAPRNLDDPKGDKGLGRDK
jgi:hypothetical protein